MDKRTAAMFKRIKTSPDGPDFIEYLERLERDNFAAFRACDSNMNDIHKGSAIIIDKILNAFRQCEKEEVMPNIDNLI